MATLIRESVDRLLGAPDREEQKRRARAAIGRFASERGDLAERHDEYFADAARE